MLADLRAGVLVTAPAPRGRAPFAASVRSAGARTFSRLGVSRARVPQPATAFRNNAKTAMSDHETRSSCSSDSVDASDLSESAADSETMENGMFEAQAAMAALIRDGKLAYKEDISDGIEDAPRAYAALFAGANFGRRLIKAT